MGIDQAIAVAADQVAVVGVAVWGLCAGPLASLALDTDQLLDLLELLPADQPVQHLGADDLPGCPPDLFSVALPAVWAGNVSGNRGVTLLVDDAPAGVDRGFQDVPYVGSRQVQASPDFPVARPA